MELYPLKCITRDGYVVRVGDGNIIRRFEKTPTPKKNSDVICPHFTQLAWAGGCIFNPMCDWCYLMGTYRYEAYKHVDRHVSPRFKKRAEIEKAIKRFLEAPHLKPHLFNAGELCDSLMQEHAASPFSEWVMPFFEGTPHKVLFLTKTTWIDHFLEHDWQENAILAWSINAVRVASEFEGRGKPQGAPNPMERINAAAKVARRGYTVRVRLDPMTPVPDWERHYRDIIDSMCRRFTPERVTLGSLRGLASTIAAAADKKWTKYLTESSNWGKKPGLETRLALYKLAIERLEKHGVERVAVCKDTKMLWSILQKEHGLNYKTIECNCLL